MVKQKALLKKTDQIQRWRLIDSGSASARWNMAVDEALLRCFGVNDTPILRLYRWQSASLSFGRFSHPKETLVWEQLQNGQIDYARRVTGGGILVHGDDLSYTLIIPRAFVEKFGVKESYRYLCGFLLTLYKGLGLDAAFSHDRHLKEQTSDICLAGKERYDIVIDNKKIGGNAQRHTREGVLQHGTVTLSIDTASFEPLFQGDSGLCDAATLFNRGVILSHEQLKEALLKAFCDTFKTELLDSLLSRDEAAYAKKLYNEKYTTEAWNVYATE